MLPTPLLLLNPRLPSQQRAPPPAMSLTQKAPSTSLTIGDQTISIPNQVVARAPGNALNTLEQSQMSSPHYRTAAPPAPLRFFPFLSSLSFLFIFASHSVCFRFVTVGSNGNLETSPPIVHFGGFRTENIHELTVSKNVSLLHRSCTVCCHSYHHSPLLF